MSGTGGIHSQQGLGGVNAPPPGVLSEDVKKGKAAGKTATVGRGFSNTNSVSFRDSGRPQQQVRGEQRVRLPQPTVDHAKAVTPEMLAQVSQAMDTTELMFTFDELLNQLAADDVEEGDSESTLTGSLFGSAPRKTKGQNQQGGDSMGRNPGGQMNLEMLDTMMKGSSALAQAGMKDPVGLLNMQNEVMGVMERVSGIISAPPEVMADLKAASAQLTQSMLSGDIEDVARILSEVQTKLQDTRIKFDEQAIQTSRLKREQAHTERIGKLTEALDKMKEADKAGILGKIFSAIATALAVVVAAVTIATGVGAKAGVMLIMAATIMVAMTISQNTGDWMTNMGGLIKDDKLQLVMGIAWAVLAASLSLGAGIAGGASKATTDAATTTVQQTANATSQAAQQSANAAAQTAQQGANATAQAAQQTAQQTATAVQETAKNAAKVATDAADDVAQQAAKVAVKSAQETAKETAKSTAETASKETAKQMAEISKKTMYFKRAAHIARFTEGAAHVADGSSTIYAAKVRNEGEMYQADAQEDLAFITKMQMQMEDWMEAIQRALQEITQGQEVASDMLAQAQQNKFKIARKI
ncbi:type III secretion system translocon subunit SctE [Parendozoicomonas haliclonae]|nr:type III secretion system translocon subunit SctE [Parendozoicomonas haliclonae]